MKNTRPQKVNRDGIAELLHHLNTLAAVVEEYRRRLRALPPVISGDEHDELDRMSFMIDILTDAMAPFGCAVRTEAEVDAYLAEIDAFEAIIDGQNVEDGD